jgi:hypothetical protein
MKNRKIPARAALGAKSVPENAAVKGGGDGGGFIVGVALLELVGEDGVDLAGRSGSENKQSEMYKKLIFYIIILYICKIYI